MRITSHNYRNKNHIYSCMCSIKHCPDLGSSNFNCFIVIIHSNNKLNHFLVCKIPGQVFNKCGSACTKTCEDPNPICTKQCVSKCECPGDKPILHEGKCIAQTQCNPIPGSSLFLNLYISIKCCFLGCCTSHVLRC